LSPDGIKDSSDFQNGWYASQKMTRDEALKSFTIWGAYAEFAEQSKGSIVPGKFADIVILSEDIMTIPALQIATTNVVMTVIGGKIRYRSQELEHQLAFH
jgi:predicted amidohydrolase YtcJ